MINKWIGIGRLTKDPELRYTQSGIAVSTFTLAVDNGFGEKKQTAFIPVVAWRQTAELTANYLKKGSQVGLEGHLSTRSYDDKDGNKRFVMEVVADQVQFLDSKKSDSSQEDPFAKDSKTVDISDSDLPF